MGLRGLVAIATLLPAGSAAADLDAEGAATARAYGDFSVFFGGVIGSTSPTGEDGVRRTFRGAVGVLVTYVAPEGGSSTRFRAGATTDYCTIRNDTNVFSEAAGLGGELGADRMVAPKMRLGLRAGLEWQHTGNYLMTAGPRLLFADLFWVGVDAFHLTNENASGILVGIGLSP